MNWVLVEIEKELAVLVKKEHTGNINFEVNMFKGGISNINVTKKRSVKEPELTHKRGG